MIEANHPGSLSKQKDKLHVWAWHNRWQRRNTFLSLPLVNIASITENRASGQSEERWALAALQKAAYPSTASAILKF